MFFTYITSLLFREKKRSHRRYPITLELRRVINLHEKRSSPKTLSLDIMFARPAECYQNTTARQPPNTATDERKLSGKIASTRRQWRDKGSCIRSNLPVGLPLRNRVLINATVNRRDDALGPSCRPVRSPTLLTVFPATLAARDIVRSLRLS